VTVESNTMDLQRLNDGWKVVFLSYRGDVIGLRVSWKSHQPIHLRSGRYRQ